MKELQPVAVTGVGVGWVSLSFSLRKIKGVRLLGNFSWSWGEAVPWRAGGLCVPAPESRQSPVFYSSSLPTSYLSTISAHPFSVEKLKLDISNHRRPFLLPQPLPDTLPSPPTCQSHPPGHLYCTLLSVIMAILFLPHASQFPTPRDVLATRLSVPMHSA